MNAYDRKVDDEQQEKFLKEYNRKKKQKEKEKRKKGYNDE